MADQDFSYSNCNNAATSLPSDRVPRGQRKIRHEKNNRSLSPMTDGEINTYNPYSSSSPYHNMNDAATASSIGTYDYSYKKYRNNNSSLPRNGVQQQPSLSARKQRAQTPQPILVLNQAVNMDIHLNDDAFQVVARYILEQLDHDKVVESRGDINSVMEIDPHPNLRFKFIHALQFRMNHLSGMNIDDHDHRQQSYIHKLTRYCHDLGLGDDDPDANPLLGDRRLLTSDDVYSRHNNENNGSTLVPPFERNDSTMQPPLSSERNDITLENNTVNKNNAGIEAEFNINSSNTIHKMELIASQSKARQQIMIELRESQQLLNEATTEKSIGFWKHHIDVLINRLNHIDKAGGIDDNNNNAQEVCPSDHNNRNNASLAITNMENNDDKMIDYQSDGNYIQHRINHQQQLQQSAKNKINNIPQIEDNHNCVALATPRSFKACHGTYNNDQTCSDNNEPQYYNMKDNDNSVNKSKKRTIQSNIKNLVIATASLGDAKMASNTSPTASTAKQDVLKVISPADLPGNYNFEVFMDQKRFLVRTPVGGVRKGQIFYSECEEMDEEVIIPIPYKKWRDGLSDCFVHGLCHTLLLNSICFPQITMGQIMTRLGLNWMGHRTNTRDSKRTFATVFIIWVVWLSINIITIYSVYVSYLLAQQSPNILQSIILSMNNVFFFIYTIYIVTVTRSYIRRKYDIRANGILSEDHGDFLLATFCTSLSVAQMGRMTADYGLYRAVCCSPTGLPEHICIATDAPDIITRKKKENSEEIYIV